MKRFVLAAPKSGSGKTTITCGMIAALKKRDLKVQSFKCGPDYIDPMFHREVLGVPSKNLDLFFTDEEKTRQLFYRDNRADISVIEGVMGLYDGLGGISEEASTYHLAKTLEAPIILVVDAHGMGRSLVAELKGFLEYDTAHLIQGVILNKITKGFFELIKPVIEKELQLSVVGFFPKQENLAIESRHLGLTMPGEQEQLLEKVNQAAEVLEECVNLESILQLMSEEPVEKEAGNEDAKSGKNKQPVRIAVARDEAFCFYYEDNLRLLKEAGAELVFFSPIHDEKLPEGTKGLLLGGGYPELFAKELAENLSMLRSIRQAIENGIPSLAECGGFMYLHESMMGEDGKNYEMVGAVKGSCEKKQRLIRFGYASFEEKNPCFMPQGSLIKGHEFHYYDSTDNGAAVRAKKPTGNRSWEACHVGENHWWGFPHLYYESCPEFAQQFVTVCGSWKTKSL
ncbi:MAG: cobyrinate a,c-diamide synthase [Lachnospiraceae bacterium]|nr:cobyrinate a,c-diamide synthase [Lachnospiraceae bacterium]